MNGTVYLVGAGPGDPGLISIRGRSLLEECDVVLHDRLVAPELLDLVPGAAERIFVGKTPENPSMPQASIDALMVEHARAGKIVVRLKGGDPFVFGRGADEAQALVAAGIDFEVVPGVSAAIAVPAYAGIPVTHSGLSSSVAILTAHVSADRPGSDERLKAIAVGAETIVLLMGVRQLAETGQKLIDAGRSPDEPTAIVEWGTTPRQRVVAATLSTIAAKAQEAGIQPPATTIVGRVVSLREGIDWFGRKPLLGQRIVVTRPPSQRAGLNARLRELGADVIPFPTIAILPPTHEDGAREGIEQLRRGAFAWVVFASANGVENFVDILARANLDARAFAGAKIAAVGPKTSDALGRHGLRPDLVPHEYTGAALVEALGVGSGRVLLPRPEGAPQSIVNELRAAGWEPTEMHVYRTVEGAPSPSNRSRVANGDFDAVTFTSASTARNFALFGDEFVALANDRIVVCIGPATESAARAAGLDVDAVAREQTNEGVVAAVVELLGG